MVIGYILQSVVLLVLFLKIDWIKVTQDALERSEQKKQTEQILDSLKESGMIDEEEYQSVKEETLRAKKQSELLSVGRDNHMTNVNASYRSKKTSALSDNYAEFEMTSFK
eukprot:CAMPEP_0116933406 /NCGR_PEP_ID=MMETSP0467-20121206/29022_1 /TAXON_ID=283647 /ORGANISM="Mesodinium pulex, Strain SPMC105" /LENGTH=109 /DNA_ID=CAMNT_0004614289 /DNA_START=1400 /DNA_END=1729 /DNA_ORIENTATION=-